MAQTSKDNLSGWGWPHAKHLLNRAGFGGKPDEIEKAFSLCLCYGPRGLDGVDSAEILGKRFEKVQIV
ncbi:hypothetical protein GWO09_32145 [candidate division KSB1 bacterium]|nr:hypothetical protein [candidate division KSB1 bacterium]